MGKNPTRRTIPVKGAAGMIQYNKAVRDRIPDIIRASGKECEVKVLAKDEFVEALAQKLQEELDEYRQSGDVAELADLVEVVYAIVEHKGISMADFERLREEKLRARGGFKKRLLLTWVREGTAGPK